MASSSKRRSAPFRAAILFLAGASAMSACGDGNVDTGASGESCSDGDVRACYPGDPATRGVGSCRDGEQQCVGDRWSDCLGFVAPGTELCGNGEDDDCNGAAEDGCACDSGQAPRACYGGPAVTRGIGECHDGQQPCVDGKWSSECNNQALPSEEACDGLDNDCTGVTDEGCGCTDGTTQPCYGGPAGSAGIGECKAGQQLCAGGVWSSSCEGQILPTSDSCNGKDDDCDGTADDGDPGGGVACSTGLLGVCAEGTQHCASGGLVCLQNAYPSSELCDGIDQNCNGVLDDGSFVPAVYDNIEYVPPGWGGLPEGVVMTWGSYLAYWDVQASAVLSVMPATDAWAALNPAGTLPPASGTTSLLVMPNSFTGSGDALAVAVGGTIYTARLGDAAGWQPSSVSTMLGIPEITDVQAATLFEAGEIGPNVTVPLLFLVTSAQAVWVVGGNQPLQMTVQEAFCPAGSSNCPASVEAMGRLPSSPTHTLLVRSGGLTYLSQFNWTNGAWWFNWTTTNTGTLSCEH